MSTHVFVKDLCIHGFHGVKDAEKSLGQKFFVDIDCEIDPPGGADRMEATVCYGELCDLAVALSAQTTFNLIETFADTLAGAILDAHAIVRRVAIEIRKPSAPIAHPLSHVGVSLVRSRDG